ncbi:F-box/LRR-repeat protein At3g26922-like [Rutidosis leptorrhynchoides]|uniref:F-box/LRR-repeat protein At3g26922-like n=1 Tax=Rutidosis leptorrhynchoides TaxID=125765 RepID=UPI003A9A240E
MSLVFFSLLDFLNCIIDNHKRRFVTPAEEDRISQLPDNLTNLILERLPIQDAVRTSILSTNWRYKWTTIGSLVLDKNFSEKFARNGAFGLNGFIRTVNQLFNYLKGPILKVYLYIPNMFLDSFQEVDQWIFSVSKGHLFVAENISNLLPNKANSLKILKIVNINFGDMDQLQGALCMLRNSPNLEQLHMMNSQMSQHLRFDVTPALRYLEASNCLGQTLIQLKTIEITRVDGSRPVLLFIKLLLAHSHTLEKLSIQPNVTDVHQRLNIAKHVMQFPRASSKAELLYLNP